MTPHSNLPLFTGAVLILLMSPGPNMAFVIAHGAGYGWRGGVAAALGIGGADLVLTMLTAAGVTAMVAQWPPALDLIRVAGATYLLWLAYKTLASSGAMPSQAPIQSSLASVFVRALLNSLLNPKALLFFMVFLPQFVIRDTTPVARQLIVLGGVLTAVAVVFHAGLGIFGGAIHRLPSRSHGAARWQSRGLAFVLVLLAVRLALTSRPA